ncbi:MAG TPA: cytochrome c biogenesis protein CcdA [Candidatus Nanoarchaeia archaeon]|nr:cytochrome c biogenesis protein CcdA [Candidatus Nanoarchaeia archaeon]
MRANTFIASIFFVLGFSVVFSVLGILLQTILLKSSADVQLWLSRLGGIVVILFGLYILKLLHIPFLDKEYKFRVKYKFSSYYVTSFVFGAAFAVGWTPCVSAALGAILTLAASSPSQAFILLMAYTLGLGIPFMLVGLFTNKAQSLIDRTGSKLQYIQYAFGIILVVIGILMFTSRLAVFANFEFLIRILTMVDGNIANGATIQSLNIISLSLAFIAGIVSFLSPCVLPIVPGFLSYLASTALRNDNQK